jgi:hypothetical protein
MIGAFFRLAGAVIVGTTALDIGRRVAGEPKPRGQAHTP